MRVSRLEIFGFKSFRDRFVLNFDRDLIGIVGPNGCGKSNLVDALRWVLGETQAKKLRGTLQEDLIFNGSDTKRPLGMAEVSITLTPDPGWTPALGFIHESDSNQGGSDIHEKQNGDLSDQRGDESQIDGSDQASEQDLSGLPALLVAVPNLFEASQIQFTRRLYRSGETEYFINSVPCRLKDISDLCRLVGLGPRGLNIVQQGAVGDIIAKKPVERRELLEQAAGIAGLRVRLEAAERQLERTNENLDRLRDLDSEIGKQVRILKSQAAKASARAQLRSSLTLLERELFEGKVVQIILRSQDARSGVGKLSEQIVQVEEELASTRDKQRNLIREEAAFEQTVDQIRSERRDLYRSLDQLKEQEHELKLHVAKAESRVKSTRANIDRIGNEAKTI